MDKVACRLSGVISFWSHLRITDLSGTETFAWDHLPNTYTETTIPNYLAGGFQCRKSSPFTGMIGELFLRLRMPIQEEGDWGSGILQNRANEKPAVASDVVLGAAARSACGAGYK
jgi:hypothetical protein